MRASVFSQKGGRIIILPETDPLQVPVYDENEEYLVIPQSDFDQLEAARDWAEEIVIRWATRRENIVRELLDMATSLDGLQYKCNISTTVGSSVGIASGAAVIGGMLLFPPVAIGGLAVGAAAATWNCGTGIFKLKQMRKRAHQARVLLEDDKNHLDSVMNAINALALALEEVIQRQENAGIPEGGSPTDGITNAVGIIALAPAILSVGARLALRESIAISSNVLKGVVHAAAGIGIALDVLTVIITAKDLLGGSRCELAGKLREVAEKIETERMELHRHFINHVSLAH